MLPQQFTNIATTMFSLFELKIFCISDILSTATEENLISLIFKVSSRIFSAATESISGDENMYIRFVEIKDHFFIEKIVEFGWIN